MFKTEPEQWATFLLLMVIAICLIDIVGGGWL